MLIAGTRVPSVAAGCLPAGVTRTGPQHLASMCGVIDDNELRAVELLDGVDEVALELLDPAAGQGVVRVERTLPILATAGIAFSGSPARTRSPSCTLTWTERSTEYSWRVPASVSMRIRRMPLTTGS